MDSGPSRTWLEGRRESCPADEQHFSFKSCQDLVSSREPERRGRSLAMETMDATSRSYRQGRTPGPVTCVVTQGSSRRGPRLSLFSAAPGLKFSGHFEEGAG